MEEKLETREVISYLADVAGSCCTSGYVILFLSSVCPPLGIGTAIGLGLLGGAIGDLGGNYAKKTVKNIFKAKDSKKNKENKD